MISGFESISWTHFSRDGYAIFFLPTLQTPVGLDNESSYGFDFGYKILQCS